jgi:hypothetical protein
MRQISVLAVLLVFLGGTVVAIADDNEVLLTTRYLTDNDGHNYALQYYLTSNHAVEVCVTTYVTDSVNVSGSVTHGPIRLAPGQKDFYIGQFTQADQSQAWHSSVHEDWVEC